ncbi:POLX protein, partial [Pseudoatta argentina]
MDKNGNVKLTRRDDLYFVHEESKHKCRAAKSENNALKIWHYRFGHLNAHDLREIISNGTIRGLDADKLVGNFECETSIKGKMSRSAFPKESNSTTELLELIHTDICGPMRVSSDSRARYFITFINDCFRWCEV